MKQMVKESDSETEEYILDPIFNWVGSKRKYVNRLLELAPESYDPDKNVYFEPFLGGGAMLLAILPRKAIVGDIDKNVINTFTDVQTSGKNIVTYLKNFYKEKSCRDTYVYLCQNFENLKRPKKSAAFIFISKHSFGSNMIYNKNRTGFTLCFRNEKINVNYDNLLDVSDYLNFNNVKFMNSSFEKVVRTAKKGDFIFMDPPYVTTRVTQKQYYQKSDSHTEFTLEKLTTVINDLDKRGCFVMLTNSKSPLISQLLPNFKCKPFKAHETILGAHGKKASQKREECIWMNY